MKEYELTQLDIEQGKCNPMPLRDCSKRKCEVFKIVGMKNLLVYNFRGAFSCTFTPSNHKNFMDGSIYRIRPLYQKPDPPVKVPDRWLEFYVMMSNKRWVFGHPATGHTFLAQAPSIVGFGGVLFDDGTEIYSPNLICMVKGVLKRPLKVRFENPEWTETKDRSKYDWPATEEE